MSLRTIFIENLKFYRRERKFSQQQLTELCGIATNYLSEIETGKKFPSIEMIENIASVLDIPPFLLFYNSETADNRKNPLIQGNVSEQSFFLRKKELSEQLIRAIQDTLTKFDF